MRDDDLQRSRLTVFFRLIPAIQHLIWGIPVSHGTRPEDTELLEHPVRIVVADDLARPRLMVLFRLFLAIPHVVWLLLWSVATFVAAVAAWIAALGTGRVPPALHRFLAAYVRYVLHLLSFLHLVGRKFPGFTGRAGSYGIDLQIDPGARQSRWKILFRPVLALPALLLGGVLVGVMLVVAFLGWFYAIVTGRMPECLRNLGVSCLRYGAQVESYLLLLTDRYPYAAPVLPTRGTDSFAP